jgi:hypothetical protein
MTEASTPETNGSGSVWNSFRLTRTESAGAVQPMLTEL